MVHEILVWPHPLLKQKAQPVAKVDDEIRTLCKDLFESMYAADGVGLAAPQIGVLKNIIVLDTTPKQPESRPIAMINPEILTLDGKIIYKEGCLSVPGEAEEVERAKEIVVRYQDEQGVQQEIKADGLLAIAVQHECDHLKGVMFVDHISALKRELIRKRMKKIQAIIEEEKAEEADATPRRKSSRAEAR
jgi:peptide deformylase